MFGEKKWFNILEPCFLCCRRCMVSSALHSLWPGIGNGRGERLIRPWGRAATNDPPTLMSLAVLVTSLHMHHCVVHAALQTGTRHDKIRIQKWYTVYKDHITLKDYEIHDGMGLELYYN